MPDQDKRVCRHCDVEQDIEQFGWTGSPPVRRWQCKTCRGKKQSEWRERNPDRPRGTKEQIARHEFRSSARKLGLDPDEMERRYEEHSGLCDICGHPCASGRRLAIDHDHETGKFRGFLCMNCNNGLGRFQDRVELLTKAIRYLGA